MWPRPDGPAWANLATQAKSLAPDGGLEAVEAAGHGNGFPHFKTRN